MDIAQIAATCRVLQSCGVATLNEAEIICEIERLDRAGKWPLLVEVARGLDLPPSTVRRVIWALIEADWIQQEPHPTDRRAKILRVNKKFLRRMLAAIEKASRRVA